MAIVELVELDTNDREKALEKLGFSIDGEGYVKDGSNNYVVCKYTAQKVHLSTAAILPGSLLIINANPLSMAQYFLEHPEDGG